jgi:hypothetical protein
MLIQLIKSEIKKIFKIKMNIILFIIAVFGTSLFFGLKYFEYGNGSEPIENQQGESISGLSLLHYIDDIRHQYAGEWSLEKEKEYIQDYQEVYDQYNDKQIDPLYMRKNYGENYQQLIDLYEDHQLTFQKYSDYLKKEGLADGIEDYDGDSQDLWDLYIYYKSTPIIEGIVRAYASGYGTDDFSSEITKHVTQLLLDKKVESSNEDEQYITDIDEEQKSQMKTYLSKQVESLPNTFDSILPNEMVQRGMDNCLWIASICIMIILANTFGIEKQYNMEQLIYPSQAGAFKITIAKIISGTLISFITMLATILMCLLVSYILLPVHTWNIAYLSLGDRGFNIYNVFTFQNILSYIFILSLMSSLVIAMLVLLLSYITKNRFAVIIAMFLYFGSIIFLNIEGFYKMLHPYTMTHSYDYFENIWAYTLFQGDIMPYRMIVPIIWVIVICVIFTMMILRSRTKSARSLS